MHIKPLKNTSARGKDKQELGDLYQTVQLFHIAPGSRWTVSYLKENETLGEINFNEKRE